MKDQKKRIGAFVNGLLDEKLSEGKSVMVLGNKPNSLNGTNEYKCNNYSALACSTNDAVCTNYGVCSYSDNSYQCKSNDPITNVITTMCSPSTNFTTTCKP